MGAGGQGSDVQPRHGVKVRPFQMAKMPTTFGQYKKCVAAGACTPAHASDGDCFVEGGAKSGKSDLPASFQGDDQPAVCLDWNQAVAFSKWAGGRLPTEAEWEYAARGAGKDWEYPWGNEPPTCARAAISLDGCGKTTAPVCSKPAGDTPQGLCDMAGNASQWVQDSYHDSYDGAPTDGSAWEEAGALRVTRGSSWYDDSEVAGAVFRGAAILDQSIRTRGFRPAR